MSKRRPNHALIDQRPWLVASFAAALAFYYLRATAFPEFYLLPIKGAACTFLAVYAWRRHSSQDAKLLVLMLLVAALGDIAIEINLLAAGALFFGYHVIALMLYLRHKREALAPIDKATTVALLFGTPVVAYLLTQDQRIGMYGLALGAMAAAAWASNFPRYRVGAGALLFVISDILIFAETGPLIGSTVSEVFVWPTYYLGQFLICIGVMQALRKRDPELRVVSRND